jgi:hypothetical protein
MKLVMQPTFSTCGQACSAMIADKDIQEVEALDFYRIKHAEKNVRISKKNPVQSDFSILTLHMTASYTQWVLFYHGKYYDPEFELLDKCHPEGRITSFLAIYE